MKNKYAMKLSPSLLLLPLILTTHMTQADEGQALHQSQCVECHGRMTGGDGTVIYKRDDRIVKNIDELKQRVAHCSKGSNTGWSDVEVSTVTDYLNNQFYHY